MGNVRKVQRINLCDQLILAIIEQIQKGNWAQGSKLPGEIELANSFSVSRNIMREALKILENFGVLDARNGIGTFVSEHAIENIENIKIKAKFNGATGNYSAILTAFPQLDWQTLNKKFVEEYLGLTYNPLTTQIESHDYTCHILDGIRHFNNVLVDFDVDMWLYISMEYFKQIPVKGEVGSSTMPHKVNPIRFENSEANVDMSNNICVGLSNKLPRSRMQRDLSDSSSQRNIGLAFGYSLQAISETTNGLAKCVVNKDKLAADLNEKWEVLAEPIQTMLRKYGISDAYDQLKELTRGKNISQEAIMEFAKGLDVLSDEDRQTLLDMTPASYIGYASNLCDIDL